MYTLQKFIRRAQVRDAILSYVLGGEEKRFSVHSFVEPDTTRVVTKGLERSKKRVEAMPLLSIEEK